MLKFKNGLKKEDFQEEELITLCFSENIVVVRKTESETIPAIEIVACNDSACTIQGMTKVILRLLAGAFCECHSVIIAKIKFYEDFSMDTIAKILSNNRLEITKNTGWNII